MESSSQLIISYARKDCTGLEWTHKLHSRHQNEGFACWQDKEDMDGDSQWLKQIPSAIQVCSCLLSVVPLADGNRYRAFDRRACWLGKPVSNRVIAYGFSWSIYGV